MANSTAYKEAPAWQQAMQLAIDIYRYCQQLPPAEQLNLSLQLQQKAVLIPSTISAAVRSGSKENLRASCQDSLLMLAEIETLLIIAGNHYQDSDVEIAFGQHDETARHIQALLQRLSTPLKPSRAASASTPVQPAAPVRGRPAGSTAPARVIRPTIETSDH